MKKKARQAELLEAFERALPLPKEALSYRTRAMFGGYGIYAHDRIFGVITADELGLKIPTKTFETVFEAVPGTRYLLFMPGEKPSKQYAVFPPDCWKDPDCLKPWIEQSIDYVQTLPIKKKNK